MFACSASSISLTCRCLVFPELKPGRKEKKREERPYLIGDLQFGISVLSGYRIEMLFLSLLKHFCGCFPTTIPGLLHVVF